jgi:hypothetical protein
MPSLNRFRSSVLRALLAALVLSSVSALAQTALLPSWNDGPAKQAVLDFVRAAADKASPKFVPPEDRIAAFDQDGTTWVSGWIVISMKKDWKQIFAFEK